MVVVYREKAYKVPKSIDTDNLPPTQVEKTIVYLNKNLSKLFFNVCTRCEEASRNKTQIVKYDFAINGSSSPYTVPVGKV